MRLTQKQETFCLKYFELGNASEAALVAGYSPKYAATHTTRWLNMANIKERLTQLRQIAEDESVATVIERKQRLTVFVREDIESDKGVPLRHSNILAAQELNKMEKIYTDGATLNQDNRTLNIYVSSDKAKELLAEIEEGVAPHKDD
ncbi:hypothetical protein ES703_76443 [subsurface metagenome]